MTDLQTQPRVLVASETRDFRQMVRDHLTPNDVFLEIGCSFGACTQLLGELGIGGVALDHAADVVAQARAAVADYANITVEQADARDMAQVQALCPNPSVILLDLGGSEPLDKVTSVLRLALKTFHPRLMIVKSEELAELASLIEGFIPCAASRASKCSPWERARRMPWASPGRASPTSSVLTRFGNSMDTAWK